MACVKQLVESGCITSIPSKYVFTRSLDESTTLTFPEPEVIPTIDFSLLTSGNAEQRTKAIKDLGKACREWGFFMVINHDVPEKLMEDMIKGSQSFFDLREEEKREYGGKALFDPIRWGTSFNAKVDEAFFWRDYLKIHVHPHFNAPTKPSGFSEIIQEYCKHTRELAGELLRGISKSLGLEESYIEKKVNIESGSHHQLLVINLYPPCPQPDMAMGLPPHTDHGFLTVLMQNELSGLQVLHNGNWVSINPLPNSFLVNTGDHMEILTNGKYKSVVHRALVNNKATRISIGTAHGPTLDTVVSPAPEFVDYKTHPPVYHGIKYRDYMQLQQSNQLNGKSCLDRLRI